MILEIFLPKYLAFFAQISASFFQKFDHYITFWGYRNFLNRKLAKIEDKLLS
jgi:hypothetical protein